MLRREKIVDGRLSKFASERSLLEQPFIKDTKITVGQHIKETIAKLGEDLPLNLLLPKDVERT